MRCREMMHLMDIWTCAKNLRSPHLHTKEHGRRKDFSREGNSGFCQVVGNRIFSRSGPTVVKLTFTNLKLTDKHFSTKKLTGKYQISKSRGRLVVTLFLFMMFCSYVVMPYRCWLIISSMLLISRKTWPIGLPYLR